MKTQRAKASRGTGEKQTFAVASLGHGRWYWVVWPALAQVAVGEASPSVRDGVAPSKLEAIDQALAVAGDDAQWLAAAYARRHYANRSQSKPTTTIAKQEFLYYDMRVRMAGGEKGWRSLPYLIVKRT